VVFDLAVGHHTPARLSIKARSMTREDFFDDLYKDYLLSEEYKNFRKNIVSISLASSLKIAVAGSTGMHISHRKPHKVPSDVDLITGSDEAALEFITKLILKFKKYRWYGTLQIQNETSFCFKGTSSHYKIKNSFGINICVLVLREKVNYWYNSCGICVQNYDDIIKYARIAKERDGKERPELLNNKYTTELPY